MIKLYAPKPGRCDQRAINLCAIELQAVQIADSKTNLCGCGKTGEDLGDEAADVEAPVKKIPGLLEQVQDSCKLSNAHDFITSFPKG